MTLLGLRSIHFPWASGLGTLGLRFRDMYCDIHISSGTLILYVALYDVFSMDALRPDIVERSWYHSVRTGLLRFRWELTMRQSRWGYWHRGKRHIPLYDRPTDVAQRAWELRKYLQPYQIIDWFGERLEVISFPSPEKNSVTIMMREPNDPTTLREVILEEYYDRTSLFAG